VRGRSITIDFFPALGEVAQPLMGLFAGAVSGRLGTSRSKYLLERVWALLPAAVALDTDFDTSENHLLAPAEINAQLDDIAILYAEWF
jgi:hypothetical protein